MKRFFSIILSFSFILVSLSACPKRSPTVKAPMPKPAKSLQTVYFDYDESNIRFDQAARLENNAEVLKARSNWTVTVEGHCDERGTNEYNLALGDRRARASKNYLINLGADPSRLNIISYGEEKPKSYCHDESCWSRNRRAEFVK